MRSTRELLVPLLKYLGDAEVHTLHSSYLYLAKNLNVSKKDLQVLMPSRVKMKKKIIEKCQQQIQVSISE